MTFAKGQSGNPGGRSAGLTHLRDLAREKTELALRVLAEVAEHGESESARVAAADHLLSRGWGKPTQEITATITQSHEAMLDALEAGVSGEIVLPVH